MDLHSVSSFWNQWYCQICQFFLKGQDARGKKHALVFVFTHPIINAMKTNMIDASIYNLYITIIYIYMSYIYIYMGYIPCIWVIWRQSQFLLPQFSEFAFLGLLFLWNILLSMLFLLSSPLYPHLHPVISPILPWYPLVYPPFLQSYHGTTPLPAEQTPLEVDKRRAPKSKAKEESVVRTAQKDGPGLEQIGGFGCDVWGVNPATR